MPTSTNVTNLKINTLTKAQYDTAVQGGVIGPNELSIITDLDESIQVTTMPVASASELGKIYQFVGTTSASYTNGYFYKCVSDGQNPATYSWEQTDVQPAGATGINWATTVDLPANSGLYDACPYYVISGGLPDGTYEFSWQMRCYGIDSNSALGMVTYKVIMSVWTVGGTTKYARGYLAPVIDGEWFPGSRNIPEGNSFYSIFRLDASGNWYLFIEGAYIWCTDIYNNNTSLAVPDCFKLSTIKNVNTGDEYTATGYLYDPNNPPAWDEGFVEGQIEMKPLANVPPESWSQNASWFSATSNTNYVTVSNCNLMPSSYGYPGGNFEELNIMASSGADIFDGTIHCKDYYAVAEIRKATGVFAGTTLGICRGTPMLYIPNNAGSCLGFVSVSGYKGADVDLTNLRFYSNSAEPTFMQFPTLNIGAPVTPQTYGAIIQYDGVTDLNYTNGYFYKASGTPVTTTYGGSLQVLSPSGASITIDWAELVDAAYNTIGWMSYDQIVSALQQNIGQTNKYYVDTGELYIEGFVGIDTTTYTNVCTVTGYGAETQVEFMITAFGSPYTEIQNGHWERVDVQPGSSLPSQTGNAGKFLTTDGTDASWSDKPLVNNATGTYSVVSGPTSSSSYNETTGLGAGAACTSAGSVAVGRSAIAGGGTYEQGSIAIGYSALVEKRGSIGIGYRTEVRARFAIQLNASYNTATNADANTFKVANDNGNFEIMSADGTIPTARLTKVNTTVTIAVADWNGGTTVTKTVNGITATGVVMVSPDPTDQAAYTSAGILCTAQATDSLTFTCSTTPTAAIDVNVVML